MTTIIKATLSEIAALVKANNNSVVDDHRESGNLKLVGLATLTTATREYVVALCDSRYFSLNFVYVDKEDGLAHVSTSSVGGVIMPMNFGGDIELAIEHYNKEQEGNPFSKSQLTEVVLFDKEAVAA